MITIGILVFILASLYFYSTRSFKYWEKRGIKYDKSLPFLGDYLRGILCNQSLTEMAVDLYWKYPTERVVGYFRSSRPELLIRDPEIAKHILITDFANFYKRSLTLHKSVFEPLMQNLFFAEGDVWKLLRQRMTPAFSTGKLRAMFYLIVERAEKLKLRALAAADQGKSLDARELMARYTTDFIGACGFGLDADALNNEDSAFRKLGASIFELSPKEIAVILLKEVFPELCQNVKVWERHDRDISEFIKEILKKRNYKPCGRNEFLDLMLECKMKGTIIGESITKKKTDGTPETTSLEFDDALITAQLFVFFAAGFETSSLATSFTLHELAYNQEVQKKAQDETDRILSKHDGKLSYDAVKEMTYLEWVFSEGLRKFPSLGLLFRRSSRPCKIPELNVNIDKDVRVIIPIQAFHNDPKYFPNPEEFRPERFDPKNFDSSNKYVYMPFGTGPRACIGERLGLMQSLAGLAIILSCFTVEPAPETVRHPLIDPHAHFVQSIKGGLPLKFRPRNNNYLTKSLNLNLIS